MNKTAKKVALVGILTALYVVMALTLKLKLGLGDISLDLGYVALCVACFTVGPWAGFVGAAGAAIISSIATQYGFSISWTVMNAVIGIGLGLIFVKFKLDSFVKYIIAIVLILAAVLIGVACKTGIECALYNIPFLVKLPKAALAFGVDSVVMIIGLFVVNPARRALKSA